MSELTPDPEKWPERNKGTMAEGSGYAFDGIEWDTVDDTLSYRAELLRESEALVDGDRNNQYGPPHQDFARTAKIWQALFGWDVDAHRVAMAMAALKLSRLSWNPEKRDSWVDLAGYAACGYECTIEEGL